MTTSKIKIKLGAIEVEYEGSETFLKEELPALLSAVSDLYQRSQVNSAPTEANAETVVNGSPKGATNANGSVTSSNTPIVGTTSSVAARLNVKSGPDLILAAAARLTLGEGLHVMPRQRLIDEMKSAPSYCNKSVLGNLSRYLLNLVKDGKLNESSKDQYALTASCRAELEARLA
ncbi:hypothetical protein KDX08_17155 [Burkholderia cenocepacia]|uniref:hypothetical protein n=1 Tax=Burkholderia cenocepacia TaxID=95486 RepID=UPI0012AED95C|nr:hypothetical protein [Burkholderia cenocepacia]MBR7994178.1 hypothetical protein [Burkholderia cenocepacia]HDR9803261.1 hypothetical protein [Burkholderia cenocepacia]HDR9810587.1 hypothetical protein [Burkholderia cenocepacia]HDR9827604.1 hypothetical protein [Burkholderia cenocepacia]